MFEKREMITAVEVVFAVFLHIKKKKKKDPSEWGKTQAKRDIF